METVARVSMRALNTRPVSSSLLNVPQTCYVCLWNFSSVFKALFFPSLFMFKRHIERVSSFYYVYFQTFLIFPNMALKDVLFIILLPVNIQFFFWCFFSFLHLSVKWSNWLLSWGTHETIVWLWLWKFQKRVITWKIHNKTVATNCIHDSNYNF